MLCEFENDFYFEELPLNSSRQERENVQLDGVEANRKLFEDVGTVLTLVSPLYCKDNRKRATLVVYIHPVERYLCVEFLRDISKYVHPSTPVKGGICN